MRALVVLLGAGVAGTQLAPAQDASRPARAASVVAFALDQFKALTPGVTLACWRARHPGDSVTRFIPPEQEDQHRGWCAHLDARSRLNDGLQVHRAVWFYPPVPSSTRSLPVASAATLFGQCTAGLVEIEVAGTDSASIGSVDSAVTEKLTARFGAPVKSPEYGNEENWSGHARWAGTGASIIAGYYYWAPQTPQQRGPIFSVAAATVGGEMHAQEFNADFHDPATAPTVRIEELFSLAGVESAIEHELRMSLAELQRPGDTAQVVSTEVSDRFINAFSAWLGRAATLPPSRRAAALLIAHDAIASSSRSGWAGDTTFADVRARLNALGAGLSYEHMSDGVEYHGGFLRQALSVAPGTRAGDIAFLMAARSGFVLSGCDDEGSGYRAVASRGAEYIRRFPQSTAVPELHFIVARAWGDIINLGSGGGFEVDSAELIRDQAEIPSARRHAIAEYRAALATLPDGPQRNASWNEAWRVMAGLAPIISHFYCTDD